MRLQRPKAFAGLLIVGLIAIVGFAAFSATGFRSAPPIDLPDQVSGKTAGALLGVDLGPDSADRSLAPPVQDSNEDSADLETDTSDPAGDTDGASPDEP